MAEDRFADMSLSPKPQTKAAVLLRGSHSYPESWISEDTCSLHDARIECLEQDPTYAAYRV